MSDKRIFKQVVNAWMYQTPDLEKIARSMVKIGADGIEPALGAFPKITAEDCLKMDVAGMMERYGLSIPCCTISNASMGLDFSHSDSKIRDAAVDHTNRCVEAVAHMGCDRVLITPSCVAMPPTYHISREEDWKRAVESIRRCGEYAAKYNVMLLLEPINHFCVGLVHTVGQACQMIEEIGLDNIHVNPDTFHMLMEEETGMERALHSGGRHVKVLHLGDNTRRAPGFGTMDWRSIIGALCDIGFDGPLSHEPVFTGYDGARMATDPSYVEQFDEELRRGIAYLDAIMENLSDG